MIHQTLTTPISSDNRETRREIRQLAGSVLGQPQGWTRLREVQFVDRGDLAVLDGDPVLRLGAAVLVGEGLRLGIGE
jgi:hypothetical protein